ncbi:hypothetical protein UY3_11551 [Chelonia mydas]|uniref:Uncharacterized protein n=1 Tax=Chelonia mydas TaxID=8469 RepID=M7BT78_CHEMY|nr:hypothetical protein UY3_11551 [Chelonia mydas]
MALRLLDTLKEASPPLQEQILLSKITGTRSKRFGGPHTDVLETKKSHPYSQQVTDAISAGVCVQFCTFQKYRQ